ALAFKRLRIYDRAHTILSSVYPIYGNKAEFLHNYAGVKTSIANDLYKKEKENRNWATIRRLREEAVELLRRAIPLFEDNQRQKAWCWFDLARTLQFSKGTSRSIEEAYQNAIELWNEPQFRESYNRWKSYNT
ncbi:hypothetical protein BZG21_40675, partial [Escherichia coli]|nr:hypothetical protein [Escherichia coli]